MFYKKGPGELIRKEEGTVATNVKSARSPKHKKIHFEKVHTIQKTR
jgi:hypothetical protein